MLKFSTVSVVSLIFFYSFKERKKGKHMEQHGWQVTHFKIRKGQSFSLKVIIKTINTFADISKRMLKKRYTISFIHKHNLWLISVVAYDFGRGVK